MRLNPVPCYNWRVPASMCHPWASSRATWISRRSNPGASLDRIPCHGKAWAATTWQARCWAVGPRKFFGLWLMGLWLADVTSVGEHFSPVSDYNHLQASFSHCLHGFETYLKQVLNYAELNNELIEQTVYWNMLSQTYHKKLRCTKHRSILQQVLARWVPIDPWPFGQQLGLVRSSGQVFGFRTGQRNGQLTSSFLELSGVLSLKVSIFWWIFWEYSWRFLSIYWSFSVLRELFSLEELAWIDMVHDCAMDENIHMFDSFTWPKADSFHSFPTGFFLLFLCTHDAITCP